LEGIGDHLETALVWSLLGIIFSVWFLVKMGALDYDPEVAGKILSESEVVAPVLEDVE
jgi:hypothetical protein